MFTDYPLSYLMSGIGSPYISVVPKKMRNCGKLRCNISSNIEIVPTLLKRNGEDYFDEVFYSSKIDLFRYSD